MTARTGLGLAATKFTTPTLPDRLVQRSRLHQILDDSVARNARLVLASAPAGSGKSTLLASWLDTRPESSAWLQIEQTDSDPTRFWSCLVESFGHAHPDLADAVRPVVTSSNGDGQPVVTALVNGLVELDEPLVLVIDDYHLVDNPAVHEGMERLIELCPAGVTFILATRIDPPFRLGRLRVRHQIVEVRGDDLRFEPSEAAGLLRPQANELSSNVIERLCGRTEGWAAGLVLAGLSLERATHPEAFVDSFHGDDQLVVDYMTDEFLASVDDEDRIRLLEVSVLDQFDGELVDAVTGTSSGAAWLMDTAKTNQLLIGLDRTGSWYRFHHLFRDLLRLEAQQSMPDRLPELHRRAAAWFESEGDTGRALRHRLAAGDSEAAITLMYRHGPALLVGGEVETLRETLAAIGEPATKDPACALMFGWCDFIGGRYDRCQEWIEVTHERAAEGFDRTITAPLRMNVLLGHGDVGAAFEMARELHDTKNFEDEAIDLAPVTGGVFMWAGRTADAREILEFACRQSEEAQMPASHLLSLIYLAINEFDEHGSGGGALRSLQAAADLRMPAYYRLAPSYAIRARTGTDPEAQRADITHAVELARRTPGDLALAFVLTACGDTLIDLGDAGGESLLTDARAVIDRCPDPGIVGRYLARIESRHGVADRTVPRNESMIEQLTDREAAVLRYLPTKLSQRDIAAELFVSRNTVKTHCTAIYRKLGVGDRKAAVQAARDAGLL